MKLAVVFDASGTLVSIRRIIKNVVTQKFLCNCQTVDIVDQKEGRSLVILKENPLEVLDNENPDILISSFLNGVNWGISYCNPPIDKSGIFKDNETKLKELQDPLAALRNMDLEKDVVVDCRIGQGSVDLVEVFDRKRTEIPHANDTSFGVGHAPLSTTEKIVLETEKLLNSDALKAEIPAVGEDIKVMGLREGKKITLTIAMAAVDKYVNSCADYVKVKELAKAKVEENAKKYLDGHELEVCINTADDDEDCIFLTVTGTSAEMGDDGSVGRGNRANGLITPFRPMSMEATSGKNPINHIGKIYNILSNIIAEDVAKIEGVRECQIRILSQIGKPVTEPKILDIEMIPENGFELEELSPKAKEVAQKWLDNISEVTERIVSGNVTTF